MKKETIVACIYKSPFCTYNYYSSIVLMVHSAQPKIGITSTKNLNEGDIGMAKKWNKRLHTPSLYLSTTVTGQ